MLRKAYTVVRIILGLPFAVSAWDGGGVAVSIPSTAEVSICGSVSLIETMTVNINNNTPISLP